MEMTMPDGDTPSIPPAPAGPTPIDPLDRGAPAGTRLKSLMSRFLGVGTSHGGLAEAEPPSGVGELPAAERAMMARIMAFDKKRVEDVAIPRADIIGVDADVSLAELLHAFTEANHSRLPVYRGDLDDPVGMVHIKDVVGLLADQVGDAKAAGTPILDGPVLDGMRRKLLYVPPSMPVTDLLLRMQAAQVHMALVIDEFGGTDGLVTIEDLIELIVGDIKDEFDDDQEFEIKQLGEGRWSVDARTPLEDLAERTDLDVRLNDEEAETIGGLVFSLAGRVPLRGEVISHPAGHEFDICDADPRRIRRVVLRQGEPQDEDLSCAGIAQTEK